jgi:hypothetical protein
MDLTRIGLAWVVLLLGLVQCVSERECTLAECVHEAVVTYPAGLVTGAYDLVIASDRDTLTARCSDPTAPEAAENPEGLTCDGMGYVLHDDAANTHSVHLTIIDVATGEVLVDQVEVVLATVEERYPNGPDCGGACYVRNGRLL